jgi:Wyosine base formation
LFVRKSGVTFCGKSDASSLNMTNTPWHHEVVELTQTLKREIDKLRSKRSGPAAGDDVPPEYEIACEHRHSCSVLLARVDQFSVKDPATGERKWRTWIDYDKFQELAARRAFDPSFTFTVEDYTAETPPWALFGSEEEGFDPTDQRHRRKSKHPKYTKFDDGGIPTHDHNDVALTEAERDRLRLLMEERRSQIGTGSVVTEFKDGAKEVLDASLMFRGLVVVK